MIQYPLSFFSSASSKCGINTLWSVESSGHKLPCAIPPEFKGPGGATKTELIVDLDENKRPVMNEATMSVVIEGASFPERLRLLADKALSSGFILNSVKTRIYLDLNFTT